MMAFHYSPFDIRQPDMARSVCNLQQMSYPIEAKLVGLETIPPMLDTVNSLMACGELFLGCFEGERLVGAVSYKMAGTAVDIYRMMVHPAWFRRGIANMLLNTALSVPGAQKALVSTGSLNTPAVRLYETNGFIEQDRVEIAPGVTITLFSRDLTQSS